VLKATIRDAASRPSADGLTGPHVERTSVATWLTGKAGHSLHKFAERLDVLLTKLELDQAAIGHTRRAHVVAPARPAAMRSAAKVRGPDGGWVDAAGRLFSGSSDHQARVDVIAMHEHFRTAFGLIASGVMTELDLLRDVQ
jgi:hypothetical protein